MVSHSPNATEKSSNGKHSHETPRQATADNIKESQPKKDGTAQKAAAEVAGLKDYQLGDCLGKGAFGSVYRALNWGTGETVAVKQVKLADLPKSELRVIMLEIDLLKNLNHPNIVKYQGFVKSTDSLYIILEYCENGSLHSICKNFGKFPENLVALYMSQVLHGLLYLHEQGVIHRDIKGANILTTKEGLVKLADFGVATKSTGLHESRVVGTPYWMAPEVIELSGATTASDIWSLGCTVIELLDGKPPYHKLQPMPALFRIVNDDHPPLPEGASPAVRDFLMQCFQKDPNLRVSARKLLKHPWILSAKRADAVIPIKPTKYDEAVKSVQEWNEALKSPNGTLRRQPRAMSASPQPTRPEQTLKLTTPAVTKQALSSHGETSKDTEKFRSPDDTANDNWDDDFDSAISPSALQMAHLKPHDNFAGLLSSEKLKSFATFDAVAEEEPSEGAVDGTVTVSNAAAHDPPDPLETVRPTVASPAKPGSHGRKKSAPTTQRQSSQPKTQILRGIPKRSPPRSKPVPLKDPSSIFREDSVEDFSDLIPTDDAVFQRKVQDLKRDASFSPKLFHPSDLKHIPKPSQPTKTGGSLKQPPTVNVDENEITMRRSKSSVAIQKFAEDITDEDFSDIFGKDGRLPKPDSDSGSDHGTLIMLNSKLSHNSWLGDEEDEDDPFAQLEDGFDEMDLETNVARDKHARQCLLVESLVGSLKTCQPDDVLADLSEQLMQVLFDSPDMKTVIISAHGMLPILEVLDTCPRRDVILRLLKVVNMIILGNVEIQENLCFVGGIPIVSRFAHKKWPSEIRLEAAAFVRQMYQTSTLTLQMFVSCGGLNVLVEFLEEDYEAEPDLVLIGVNGVHSVFLLQGPTPKNDFCRIFSRSSVLYPLSLVLNRVLDEEGELAERIEGRIVNIFYLFSQAENHVKEIVADRMVLKRVLKDLPRMSPNHQITMLKFIKNLSMLATTLDALQNSNAIEVLTELLSRSMKLAHFREISNQVLNIMFNLCRLSKTRQEDAALSGVIPLLQRIVKTERPLKEFALPILCDMAHSGKVGRTILWQNKGLQFYISLLADPYWQVTALDAIFVWLQEETAKVEEHLLDGSFSKGIVDCFTTSKADAFEKLLEPLQKLLRLSPPVAASLANPELFSRTVQKLQTKKAVVRLNLLRIIRSICDASEEQGSLIHQYGLQDAIQRLAEHDPAILVREMASDLARSSERQSREIDLRRPSRRTSSSTMTPPPLISSQSLPPTPQHPRSGQHGSSYFDIGLEPPTRVRVNGTPLYRPTSRDGNAMVLVNGLSGLPLSGGQQLVKSRLPRTSSTRSSRMGVGVKREENITPTHVPGNNLNVVLAPRNSSSVLNPRRRRQTSSGHEGPRVV